MSSLRKPLTVLLLVFAVFTLGFAVGKEVGVRKALGERPAAASAAPVGAPAGETSSPHHVLQAWYFHSTKRCVTCNTIEAFAKETLDSRFADLVGRGAITWQTANMDDVWNEDVVRRYGLIRSSLVLVDTKDGVEQDHAVLNRTWDLTGNKAAFLDYVQSEVEMFVDSWPDDGAEAEE